MPIEGPVIGLSGHTLYLRYNLETSENRDSQSEDCWQNVNLNVQDSSHIYTVSDFPLLGEKCSGGLTSDCYMGYEQTCVDDECKCKEGLRGVVEGNDDDRNAMYPGISQCRNASLPAGM